MKNEILTRAIGDIDEDLIADAHTVTKRVRVPVRRLGAIAACMLLFFCTLIYIRLPNDAVRFEGNALSDIPTVVAHAAPAVHALDPQSRAADGLTVSLQVRLRDAARITAADGSSFRLLRDGTVLCDGSDTVASGRLTIEWSVRTPDPATTYSLTVGDAVLTLRLDPTTENWQLCQN